MQKRKILTYVISIAVVQLVGFAGTLFTTPSIQSWYSTITKPSFNPPNWVFGPVWTILFILIGISLGAVWSTSNANPMRSVALKVFGVQLFLNLTWSFLFFYLHRPGLAVVEILILLASIAANIYYANKARRSAGWIMLPYFLWVSFATILNIAIWRLNS